MSVHHDVRRWIPALSMLLFAVLCCGPGSVQAGDYARNDVLKRKFSFVAMGLPAQEPTIALMAHGAISQQLRHLYLGLEAMGGYVVDGRPVIGAGVIAGLDAAPDAWTPVSMYAQTGTKVVYSFRGVQDLLVFHVETGLRFLLSSHSRPHFELNVGMRLGTSLNHGVVAIMMGGTFSYD
jgi:hypothetical protein